MMCRRPDIVCKLEFINEFSEEVSFSKLFLPSLLLTISVFLATPPPPPPHFIDFFVYPQVAYYLGKFISTPTPPPPHPHFLLPLRE